MIPAHPLALDAARRLDERRQRALTRYYIDAGAGGLAVGVHTTQFAIRERRAVRAGARTGGAHGARRGRSARCVHDRRPVRAHRAGLRRGAGGAGASATTPACCRWRAMKGASVDELIAHCAARGRRDPADRLLPADRRSAASRCRPSSGAASRRIDNVVAIKMAPFNRYRTLDVVRGVVAAGAEDARHALHRQRRPHRARPAGAVRRAARRRSRSRCASAAACSATGAVWTRSAVEHARSASSAAVASRRGGRRRCWRSTRASPTATAPSSTSRNGFAGCIPGCHEVLRRQGLLAGHLVPRPERDACRPARPKRSTASAASTPTWPTTPSSPPTCRAGWAEAMHDRTRRSISSIQAAADTRWA